MEALEFNVQALAKGRATKRANAVAAFACGALPGIILAGFFPPSALKWLLGLLLGLLYANWFEYAYHRYLLHRPKSSWAREHLRHHMSVGTAEEPEYLNLGRSPLSVALMFIVNSPAVVLVGLLLGWRIAPGVLVGFTAYFLITEEIHWRMHTREWLPAFLDRARAFHLAHHEVPGSRFSIFLPIWDVILGPVPHQR
jgi:sterol desaturase/sphingolipid hydroxylase (fatty acid hydroxylase superfamily)